MTLRVLCVLRVRRVEFSVKRVANKTRRVTTRRRPGSKPPARKAIHARLATVLEAIPNVGASIARDVRSIGIKQPRDLVGRNPHSLYQALCDRTRTRQDPCVLDTFISAVRFMEGAPARPWWSYTAERKKKFPASSLGAPSHGACSRTPSE